MNQSKIKLAERTWNLSTGCTKISPACKYCSADAMAKRLQAMGVSGYENGFEFNIVPSRLDIPLRRKSPTVYFVNSMSDLFHEEMPFVYLDRIFDIISQTPQHTYQILTKRADVMYKYFEKRSIPKNVQLGVTVENKKDGLPRIDLLRSIKASILFLSVEPILEDLGVLDLSGIDWVILGDESGLKAHPMEKSWVLNVKSQCEAQDVPFFFKKWGNWTLDMMKQTKKASAYAIDNEIWWAYPENVWMFY